MTTATDRESETRIPTLGRPAWWREVLYILAFYFVYSWVRNHFGSSGSFSVSSGLAEANAVTIIDIEKSIGLFFEEAVQTPFLDLGWFLWFWNVFYGSLHFIVTIAVMVFLFVRFPVRYRRYRNALLATTGLALVGFALFPLMPPRLLDAGGLYGANLSEFDFVDTLVVHGGLWSFDSGTVSKISNQWAAMPSLHFAWATWCVVAAAPMIHRRSLRWALYAYPALTVFAIIVTANHYWIDAVAGAIILIAGWFAAIRITALYEQVKLKRQLRHSSA